MFKGFNMPVGTDSVFASSGKILSTTFYGLNAGSPKNKIIFLSISKKRIGLPGLRIKQQIEKNSYYK